MFRAFLIAALVPFMLTACGKTESQKAQERAEAHVNDGKANMARMDAINQDVAKRFGVVLLAGSSVSTTAVDALNEKSIAGLNKAQLVEVQKLATEFIQAADAVLRAIDSENVIFTGDRSLFERGREGGRKVFVEVTRRLNGF
jgi:hypothetical protein